MPVTMKEIAKLAGVSQPAVSAALSSTGTTKVSDEMRQKILRIAEELNYTPNNAAQRLKGRATQTIGIFGVPYVSVLTQALMLNISLELKELDYNLLTCYGEGRQAAVNAVKELVGKGIDGLIITTELNPLPHFRNIPVPYVFAPSSQVKDFDVAIDRIAGTEEAFEQLYRKGCRRAGYAVLLPRDLTPGHPNHDKYIGLLNGMKRHHIKFDPEAVISLDMYQGNAEKIVKKIRSLQLDALFCSNDYLASRLMTPLLRAGIRIPEDLMLVGHDGLTLCDIAAVPLTTIVQPNRLFAEQIVKLLMTRIRNRQTIVKPEGILLKPYFYPSESCGFSNPKLKKIEFGGDTFSTLELNWELYHNQKKEHIE